MNKKLLLILLVLLPSLSFGQETYRPFLEDGKVWKYLFYNDFTGKEFYKSFTVRGDTIIGDNNYRRIVDVSTGNFEYAMREEGKKVFCANPNKAETLLYDFGLNIGDSFYMSDNPNPGTQATVVAVDTIIIGNHAFRVLDVRLNGDCWANWWVEGIGSMEYLSNNFPKVGNFYHFSSCQLNGETLLTDEDVFTACLHNHLLIREKVNSARLFDLQGRHIDGQTKPGVYIRDGRKVLIK